jgi:hypothetical protein
VAASDSELLQVGKAVVHRVRVVLEHDHKASNESLHFYYFSARLITNPCTT